MPEKKLVMEIPGVTVAPFEFFPCATPALPASAASEAANTASSLVPDRCVFLMRSMTPPSFLEPPARNVARARMLGCILGGPRGRHRVRGFGRVASQATLERRRSPGSGG